MKEHENHYIKIKRIQMTQFRGMVNLICLCVIIINANLTSFKVFSVFMFIAWAVMMFNTIGQVWFDGKGELFP